jgi:hypothetical protein
MILQGSVIKSVGHARSMAAHLFKEENEDVIVRESLDGEEGREAIENSLVEMQLYTRMTKGKTGIFSVAMNSREDEDLTPEQEVRAIEIIEQQFNLSDQARIQVDHLKAGSRHSHMFWSLVNQEEQKLISISHYKRRLQACAIDMEREFDLQQTKRMADENTLQVSHDDRLRQTKENNCIDRKKQIAKLWNSTDNVHDFVSGVRAAGYDIAKGERSRFILVDKDGQPYNLVRDLPKVVRAKDVRSRFGDYYQELSSFEETKKKLLEQQTWDREQANIDRQVKELEAADLAAQKHNSQNPKPEKQPAKEKPNFSYDTTHLNKLDREMVFNQIAGEKRAKLKKSQEELYGRAETLGRIKALQDKIKKNNNPIGKLTGKYKNAITDLSAAEKNLANVDQRICEQNEGLEAEIQEERASNDNQVESVDSLKDQLAAAKEKLNSTESKPIEREGPDFEYGFG